MYVCMYDSNQPNGQYTLANGSLEERFDTIRSPDLVQSGTACRIFGQMCYQLGNMSVKFMITLLLQYDAGERWRRGRIHSSASVKSEIFEV